MKKALAVIVLFVMVLSTTASKGPLGHYHAYGEAGRHAIVVVPQVDPPPPPPGGPVRG